MLLAIIQDKKGVKSIIYRTLGEQKRKKYICLMQLYI